MIRYENVLKYSHRAFFTCHPWSPRASALFQWEVQGKIWVGLLNAMQNVRCTCVLFTQCASALAMCASTLVQNVFFHTVCFYFAPADTKCTHFNSTPRIFVLFLPACAPLTTACLCPVSTSHAERPTRVPKGVWKLLFQAAPYSQRSMRRCVRLFVLCTCECVSVWVCVAKLLASQHGTDPSLIF